MLAELRDKLSELRFKDANKQLEEHQGDKGIQGRCSQDSDRFEFFKDRKSKTATEEKK
jgi:hypothetical protein